MPLAHRKPTCDSATQVIWEDSTILGKTYVYEYDKAGNITKKYIYALTAANTTPQNPEETYIYGYGDADWGDKLTSYRGESITYDEVGNPLSYYNGRRLATATVDGVTLTFTYNADGIRTSKTVGGSEHIYHLNGTQIITETWTQGQSAMIYLYDAEGAPVGMMYRNSTYPSDTFDTFWFEKNLQGDIVAVYDEDGTKLISYTYDAWGYFETEYHNGCTASSVANYNPFLYRGYYYDAELQMYYLQSRYYDPIVGRFISSDGLEYLGANSDLVAYNLYAYCSNNPISYTDPTGHFVITSTIIAIAIGGAIAGALISTVSYAVNCGIDGNDVTALGVAQSLALGAISGAVGAIAGYIGGSAAIAGSVLVGGLSGLVTACQTDGTIGQKIATGVVSGLITGFGTYFGTKMPILDDTDAVAGVCAFVGGLFLGTPTEMVNVAGQRAVGAGWAAIESFFEKDNRFPLRPQNFRPLYS